MSQVRNCRWLTVPEEPPEQCSGGSVGVGGGWASISPSVHVDIHRLSLSPSVVRALPNACLAAPTQSFDAAGRRISLPSTHCTLHTHSRSFPQR